MIDPLVEQGGIDLGGCLVGEPPRVQQIQHGLALRPAQRARPAASLARATRRRGQAGSPALHRGARHPERGTDRGRHAADRRQRCDGFGQGTPPSGAIGIPNRSASFFWTVDDRLGADEAARQIDIMLFQYRDCCCQRI